MVKVLLLNAEAVSLLRATARSERLDSGTPLLDVDMAIVVLIHDVDQILHIIEFNVVLGEHLSDFVNGNSTVLVDVENAEGFLD